jgi:Flp pilus assembly protein TadG
MGTAYTSQRISRRRRGERGESLVEFAFASVIFFAIVFGALEFGNAIWNYNLISDLAQEGARYAAVHGLNSGSPANTAAVDTFVQGRASGMLTGITVSTPAGSPSTLKSGDVVSVRVDYTITAGGGLIPSWNIPIYSTANMIVAR